MLLIPGNDLDVRGLCLGGNVFGWTADERASFAVLDAFVEAGGSMVDTADSYSAWAPGHVGGESEQVLGRWAAARGRRDEVVIATKVGKHPALRGLRGDTVRTAVEACLSRLQTDRIDLLYAHADDLDTPVEETVGVFDELVRSGKVRAVGASNFSTARLRESLAYADAHGLTRYTAVQDQYNLVARGDYEGERADLVAREGLASFPFYGLAAGYLTGKYRHGPVDSARAQTVARYQDARGERVLDALSQVAAAHGASMATVALAWLLAQPTVTAPIASSRSLEQLPPLLAARTLELSADELAALTLASA